MTTSNQSFTLSTGVTVEVSTRKNNRTGYTGSALSPSWTLDSAKPFIAACGNPSDPAIKALLKAQLRTSLHMGNYSDAREAAYVVGMYRKDPVNTIQYFQSNDSWDTFPEDLYNLPVGLEYDEAVKILTAKSKNSVKSPRKSKVVSTSLSSIAFRPVKDAFYDAGYNWEVIKDLCTRFGTATVSHDYEALTVNEFELRYGITK